MTMTPVSPSDPKVIIAGIRQFGLAPDGSDLRDLEAAIDRQHALISALSKGPINDPPQTGRRKSSLTAEPPADVQERAQVIAAKLADIVNDSSRTLSHKLYDEAKAAIASALTAETKRSHAEAREAVVQWMLLRSIPTGNGDTLEGLLAEIADFIEERLAAPAAEQRKVWEAEAERDRLREIVDLFETSVGSVDVMMEGPRYHISNERFAKALEAAAALKRES